MTISELGSLGEIIGAAATVATLLYLALQIRSNTLATKRQALDDTIDRIARWYSRLTDSPELLRTWIDGHQSFSCLSVEDQLRFDSLAFEIFAACEASLEAAKFGAVKPETAEAVQSMIGQLSRSDGIREWWVRLGSIKFAKDFVRVVDRLSEEARTAEHPHQELLPFLLPPTTRVAPGPADTPDLP
jgi:hypothetical protein